MVCGVVYHQDWRLARNQKPKRFAVCRIADTVGFPDLGTAFSSYRCGRKCVVLPMYPRILHVRKQRYGIMLQDYEGGRFYDIFAGAAAKKCRLLHRSAIPRKKAAERICNPDMAAGYGKTEIGLSKKARVEIGGIVKACTTTAVRNTLAERKLTLEEVDTVLRAQEALRQDERIHRYMLDDGEKMIIDTKRREEKIGCRQILFALAADNCIKI